MRGPIDVVSKEVLNYSRSQTLRLVHPPSGWQWLLPEGHGCRLAGTSTTGPGRPGAAVVRALGSASRRVTW